MGLWLWVNVEQRSSEKGIGKAIGHCWGEDGALAQARTEHWHRRGRGWRDQASLLLVRV